MNILNKTIRFAQSFGLAACLATLVLTSCQGDMKDPSLEAPKATKVANTTIADLKTAFAGKTILCPMKDEASKTPFIIHGRVVSSDASGNIYKAIVIQDETAAITISVNQSSTYAEYRLGQEIVMDVTGLYIGYYNGLQQIGWLGSPYNGEAQLTFMSWDMFKGHSEMNDFPNPNVQSIEEGEQWPSDAAYCVIASFDKLPADGEAFRNMQSQLVEFRNVSFAEGGKETYAPYQESVNRTLQDSKGGSLLVRTSGYSNFYNDTIPAGSGKVKGILSYYSGAWQLLLRSENDVMIMKRGQKKEPFTVAEADTLMNKGLFGWVSGYIVGSVKAGVQNVVSANDVIFGADAELQNNILIADSPKETDYKRCIAVSLPQGSDFRKAVNIVDNPKVLGKSILVNGQLSTFLGMPGLLKNGGTSNDVEVEGVTIGGPSAPTGDGTKESPYSVEQISSMTAEQPGVWVEGYVAGYVPGQVWSEAVFGTTPTEGSTNYTNGTNIVLSSVAPSVCTLENSIPVGLSTKPADVRTTLAISKNPSIYGKKIKIKGYAMKYFGVYALKNVTEYEVDGVSGGDSGTNTPNPDNPSVGDGDGSEAKPFTVGQVKSSTADKTGVWVIGYVAGYVPSAKWDEAKFSLDSDMSQFTNTNVVLSGASTDFAEANSIPCQLPKGDMRTKLGLGNNPSIFKKKIIVKGDIATYFLVRGIKNITEYKEIQ